MTRDYLPMISCIFLYQLIRELADLKAHRLRAFGGRKGPSCLSAFITRAQPKHIHDRRPLPKLASSQKRRGLGTKMFLFRRSYHR